MLRATRFQAYTYDMVTDAEHAALWNKRKPRKGRRKSSPLSPDSLAAGVWTRIRNVAAQQGLSVEELAAMPDRKLMHLENFGRACLRAIRG
jgi:ribosome-binding protein aMBF1 (putative translation factor)